MRSVSLAALTLLVSPLASQTDRDSFNYANGAVVPGWTQQRGTWQVNSGRIGVTSGSLWAYITKDGLSAKNSVQDGQFFFVGAGTQFAGLAARHPGGNLDTNLLMVKIQNNGGLADFDRIFSYERPQALGTFYVDIPGGTLQAECRMITLDNEFWIEIDADLNGKYELSLPRRPIVSVTGPGLQGMNCFGTSEMDDYEFFDAVLVPQLGSLPQIGTTYTLDLDTPSANVPWLGLLSLGKAGIPLDVPRAVPLTLDALLITTLGGLPGLTGITDALGKATPTIAVPNNIFLIGLEVYASAVTLDLSQPFAIGHIANEHYFKILP